MQKKNIVYRRIGAIYGRKTIVFHCCSEELQKNMNILNYSLSYNLCYLIDNKCAIMYQYLFSDWLYFCLYIQVWQLEFWCIY